MSDLYKLKVYVGTTMNFADATYLQDTIISQNFNDPANFGVLVNRDGSTSELYDVYLEAGIFNLAFPFIYDSSIGDMSALENALNYFQFAQACKINLTGISTTTEKRLFITTDNADTYLCCRFETRSGYMDIGSLYLYNKRDGSQASTHTQSLAHTRYPYSLYAPVFFNNSHLAFTFYTGSDLSVTYKIRSDRSTDTNKDLYQLLLANDTPWKPTTDPYNGAGDSGTGGGDGTFDGSSDPVPVPSLPSVGATDTGFITLFVPTRAQLKQVAEYMWGGLFDVSTWKRLFEDPMDCILGLSVVPVTVPATTSGNITVGNIELSGISLPIANQQYVEVDCGTIDFSNRYFGSYLDFEPYTKMSLFVPYSGVHSVSADDIIGKVVGLKYHIDILTGSLVAFLTCGDSVLYEFNGACASNIPVNSMNYASTIENAIRIAVNIGTTVATAGASAPITGTNAVARQKARDIGTGVSLAGSTTEGALSLKPNIDRAGSLGGTTGLMGNQIPYFIITRPRLCKPKNQDFFQGYPSFIQTSVGDLIGKGFTSFTNIIIAESFMTDAENEELETILQGGVYL